MCRSCLFFVISGTVSMTITVSAIAIITVACPDLHVIDNDRYFGELLFTMELVDKTDLLFESMSLANDIECAVCKFAEGHSITYHSNRSSIYNHYIKFLPEVSKEIIQPLVEE